MSIFHSLGRWLFALPFALFGCMHFMNADAFVKAIPTWLPGGMLWVYLTGIGLVAAAIAMVIQKYDKLAADLLGIMLLIFVLTMHLPGSMDSANPMALFMLLKDLSLAGACFLYANYLAKDASIVG